MVDIPEQVLLVDDHPLFRQGLRALVAEAYPDMAIREAGTVSEAGQAVSELKGGVLVADITLPDGDGLSLAEKVLRSGAPWRVYILTMHKRSAMLKKARDIGCRGYFLKEADGNHLLRAVAENDSGFHVSPQLEDLLTAADDNDSTECYRMLTRREKEIFRFFSQGMNYKEVAYELGISPRTVTSHRYNIFCKMGVHSDLELANIARDLGIIN